MASSSQRTPCSVHPIRSAMEPASYQGSASVEVVYPDERGKRTLNTSNLYPRHPPRDELVGLWSFRRLLQFGASSVEPDPDAPATAARMRVLRWTFAGIGTANRHLTLRMPESKLTRALLDDEAWRIVLPSSLFAP